MQQVNSGDQVNASEQGNSCDQVNPGQKIKCFMPYLSCM